jgi:hypothetical protein
MDMRRQPAVNPRTDEELAKLIEEIRGMGIRGPLEIGTKYLIEFIYRLLLDTQRLEDATKRLLITTYILLGVSVLMLSTSLMALRR